MAFRLGSGPAASRRRGWTITAPRATSAIAIPLFIVGPSPELDLRRPMPLAPQPWRTVAWAFRVCQLKMFRAAGSRDGIRASPRHSVTIGGDRQLAGNLAGQLGLSKAVGPSA